MFHANHLFLILLTLFTNVIKDVLQRFLRLLIAFFRTAQDDTFSLCRSALSLPTLNGLLAVSNSM